MECRVTSSAYSFSSKASGRWTWSRTLRISSAALRMEDRISLPSQCSASSEVSHDGAPMRSSRSGNSNSRLSSSAATSSSRRLRMSTACTGTAYFSFRWSASVRVSASLGWVLLSTTMKGLPSAFSSPMARSSAFSYASRGRSTMLPSVVTTTPMVECSAITLRVPTSAASSKGMSCSNQGVRTMR